MARLFDLRWALAAGVLAALSVLLGGLARRYDTFPLDTSPGEWVNGWREWYEPVATLTNDHDFTVALGAALVAMSLLARRRCWSALLLFPLAAVLRLALGGAKVLVDRPRPTGLEVRDLMVEGSSFPSGHVMTAVTVWGLWILLAEEIVPRRLVIPVRLMAGLVILVHAISRIWAGVHWPSDTYGAVIWMSAALAMLMALRPAFARLMPR